MAERVAAYYVYRNLRKKTYSVRVRGKVLASYRSLYMLGVDFHVLESGRQRVIEEQCKNVHAFCRSYVPPMMTDWRLTPYFPDPPVKVVYEPYDHGHFWSREHGWKFKVTKAALVALTPTGVFAYAPTLEKV